MMKPVILNFVCCICGESLTAGNVVWNAKSGDLAHHWCIENPLRGVLLALEKKENEEPKTTV